eukprot:TRINITY_DN32083_c0_g1_i1.p1 TRINITY_DN32083_c0_g1~~TRINITY_DN32083_c0_g1_i1.p1  ORF type:complete len:315 (+),score=84.10 TRINITY_DN32083_c0_g1_i1:79-945(+)
MSGRGRGAGVQPAAAAGAGGSGRGKGVAHSPDPGGRGGGVPPAAPAAAAAGGYSAPAPQQSRGGGSGGRQQRGGGKGQRGSPRRAPPSGGVGASGKGAAGGPPGGAGAAGKGAAAPSQPPGAGAPDAAERREQNVQLMRRMKRLLGGSDERLAQFRLLSSDYLKGSITSTEYYRSMQGFFGGKIDDIYPDLVELLPDPQKREALRLVHLSATAAAPGQTAASAPGALPAPPPAEPKAVRPPPPSEADFPGLAPEAGAEGDDASQPRRRQGAPGAGVWKQKARQRRQED